MIINYLSYLKLESKGLISWGIITRRFRNKLLKMEIFDTLYGEKCEYKGW